MRTPGKVVFLAGILAALGAGWLGFPRVAYSSRQQPVKFDHQVHAKTAGNKCEDCHALRPDGSFSGTPELAVCAACHASPMGTTAAEKEFIDHFVTPGKEPAWFSYARQPENVYFSHATHVKLAKLACARCHGTDGQTPTLRPYQEDRISGYSRDIWGRPVAGSLRTEGGMKMDDCIACHRENGLAHSCMDCHK